MDISDFPVVKETSEVLIRNPVTQEYMFTVEIYGPDTDFYRRAQIEIVRSSSGKKATHEDLLQGSARMMAKITKSWSDLTMGDNDFECTEENAFKIYSDFKYIADQVELFLGDRLNFLELA